MGRNFAGPLAHGVLDLVFAFLGRYRTWVRTVTERAGVDRDALVKLRTVLAERISRQNVFLAYPRRPRCLFWLPLAIFGFHFTFILVALGVLWMSGASLGCLAASSGHLGSCPAHLGTQRDHPGALFWSPLASLEHPLGSILDALDSHLAPPGEMSRNVAEMSRF